MITSTITQTIRLVPSTFYTTAGTTVLSSATQASAYTNTDSETYATYRNNTASTTNVYLYLRGFNFSDVPSNATVTGFTVKCKVRESGLTTTASSAATRLCNGTTLIAGTGASPTTTVSTQTFTGVSATYNTISGYGDDFGIRFNARRNNRNTVGYLYVYGAEIDTTYTIPTTLYEYSVTNVSVATVTPTSGYIASGSSGTIYFSDIASKDEITVQDNGVDVTSSLQSTTIPGDSVSVGTTPGASYGFADNGTYYVSQNKGISYSAALCRVNITSVTGCTLRFYVVNYAEAKYDYGIIGKVDASLLTTTAVTDTSSFAGWSSQIR